MRYVSTLTINDFFFNVWCFVHKVTMRCVIIKACCRFYFQPSGLTDKNYKEEKSCHHDDRLLFDGYDRYVSIFIRFCVHNEWVVWRAEVELAFKLLLYFALSHNAAYFTDCYSPLSFARAPSSSFLSIYLRTMPIQHLFLFWAGGCSLCIRLIR